jgi:hypothetical protein
VAVEIPRNLPFLDGGDLAAKHPGELVDSAEYGETIRSWCDSSKVRLIVTRQVVATLCLQQNFTLAELEVLYAAAAGRTAIQRLLKTVVELKLLAHHDDGYCWTKLLFNEAFDRILFKLLDEDVIAFYEFVVMFNNLKKTTEIVGEFEKSSGRERSEAHLQTIAEALYNDEVFASAVSF